MTQRRFLGNAARLALALALGAHAAPAAAEPAEPVALAIGPAGLAVAEGEIENLDVDRYAVSLAAGEILFVALFDPDDGTILDTRIAVSRAGTVLASNDDGGPRLLSRLAVQAAAAGSHEIAITGFRDAVFTGAHPEGQGGAKAYTLVVAVGTPPLDGEGEPNDAAPGALPSAGAIVRGTLEQLDVDRFEIPVAGGAALAVSLFPLDATGAPLGAAELGDPRLGLFAGEATPFAEDDDGGPGFFANVASVAPASPVEIAVTGFRDAGFAGTHAEGPFAYALVVAPLAAAPVRCDVVPEIGVIDVRDAQAIFAARGTPATGPDDPRDADGDGQITVLDASQCRLECTFPQCASHPPQACGLVGIEPLAVYGLARLLRRRRMRRNPEVR